MLSMAEPPRTRTAPPVPVADPPSRGACWGRFLMWSVGVPVVVLVGLAVIAGALWLVGGWGLTNQAMLAMGDALFWIAAIALMYPAMLVIWVLELRDGLRAAKVWNGMDPATHAAAREDAARGPSKRSGPGKGKRT
jgi:hypothetical protein